MIAEPINTDNQTNPNLDSRLRGNDKEEHGDDREGPDDKEESGINLSPRKRVKAHIEQLEQNLTDLKAEVEAERDKRLRLLAEYDNYRRRTQSEYRGIVQLAGERIILKLLPLLDDFERLFAQKGEASNASTQQAIELIQKKLQSALSSEGLIAVESVGKPFDATIHEAVAEIPLSECAPGTIVAEAEKGYKLGDKIIRHAKVVVAKGIEEGNEE